jgi:hypothetical protein
VSVFKNLETPYWREGGGSNYDLLVWKELVWIRQALQVIAAAQYRAAYQSSGSLGQNGPAQVVRDMESLFG